MLKIAILKKYYKLIRIHYKIYGYVIIFYKLGNWDCILSSTL
jgi:hypothetical protein